MNVCVYGAASDRIDPVFLRDAERLGFLLGQQGHTLVFGAGATGMMGACARGISRAGGRMVGVAPRFFDQEGVLYPGCTEMIFTDTMRQRKQIMEQRSQAFVMTPGGMGTLEEFFEILTLRQLERHQKPIYILNTAGFFDQLVAFLKNAAEQGFLKPEHLELFRVCQTPELLLEALAEVDCPGGEKTVHAMRLAPEPFGQIRSGGKTMELRLYDEKRQGIRPGDTVVFTNTATGETLSRTVRCLHRFASFEELYGALPLTQCGYTPEEVTSARPSDMERYYSPEQQKRYGVVALELAPPEETREEV